MSTLYNTVEYDKRDLKEKLLKVLQYEHAVEIGDPSPLGQQSRYNTPPPQRNTRQVTFENTQRNWGRGGRGDRRNPQRSFPQSPSRDRLMSMQPEDNLQEEEDQPRKGTSRTLQRKTDTRKLLQRTAEELTLEFLTELKILIKV